MFIITSSSLRSRSGSAVSPGARVLCKHGGSDLWHSGAVCDVLHSEGLCSVQCEPCGRVVQCGLGEVCSVQEEDGEGAVPEVRRERRRILSLFR